MSEQLDIWVCPNCGEANLTFVDVSAEAEQSYVEECQACASPSVLKITVNQEGEVAIEVELE
ncbi:MAG TPA: CPXCG motif-containing cysteine-rich protein [Blastocatellia bacterium]|nr:CPXCG motif-containing cysteine-rich protein [Blastocatellia bacterium]